MEAFLHRVARTYIQQEKDNLSRCCFVFPNKRSGTFFLSYLKDIADDIFMLPGVVTISDLVNSLSGSVEAGRLELLFILYNEYVKVIEAHNEEHDSHMPLPGDFDKFMYWGDVLLSDFNDVDKYLVNPAQLFKNVKDFKELNSNYLTLEQKEIIKRYWGNDAFGVYEVESGQDAAGDSCDFWKHVQGCGTSHKAAYRFLKLWEILHEVYTSFNNRLNQLGISYSGAAYRAAAMSLKDKRSEEFPYCRYVFVGFNVLSTSELLIFERLKAKGLADFYWDYNSPALRMSGNKASRFLSNYIKEFKSLYDIGEEPISDMPDVHIIGVPSNIGQVKEVSGILKSMTENGQIKDLNNAIDTALVLPDENLFLPLMSNIPHEIENVNITMGFPLRNSPVAMLVSKIVGMQLRVRYVKGVYEFFRDDVLNVLSHPLMQNVAGEVCGDILAYMNDKRLYNLPEPVVTEHFPQMSPIFVPIGADSSADCIYDYIRQLLNCLKQGQLNDAECRYVARCEMVVEEMQSLTSQYGIIMHSSTFFHLVERALNSESISFTGEPLKGLQIMGVLETRALDFKNVIMLSMNERVFPRRHFSRSFIPDVLRRGYGMATIEFQESIYAYYFYRLIARATDVYLLFDARNTGLRSGEMSRYLYQLRYFFNPANITYDIGKYYIEPGLTEDIVVEKTDAVMDRLNRYMEPDSGFNLSASAFKQYIKCPLQFYFERVACIKLPDEIKDYIDEGTYGDIVHHVAEKLYTDISQTKGPITDLILDELEKDGNGMVDRQITASINELYNKLGKNDYTPLQGEALIQAGVMKYLLKALLRMEHKFAPIEFEDAEWRRTLPLKIDDEHTVNFTLSIDRIDVSQGVKRVIDYKTGSDETTFSSIESLFSAKKNYGGIFQTFLYCCVYSAFTGYDGDIQPYIYSLRTLNATGLPPIRIGTESKNQPITGYLAYKDEFWQRFTDMVREIFDPSVPFVRDQSEHACAYCKYTRLCGRK